MSGTAGHWLPKRLGLRPASAAKAEVTVEVLNNSEPRTGLPSLKKKKINVVPQKPFIIFTSPL